MIISPPRAFDRKATLSKGPPMFSRTKSALLGAAICAIAPGAALAHMPYLMPNYFDVADREHVTVQASFTEDAFAPDVVMRSDSWFVRGPAGPKAITEVTYLRDLAAFEAALPTVGTYRISSGERLGRNSKMYKDAKGDWIITGESGETPAGAALVDVQSVTAAEVYVTRGAPTREALAPTGKGLEMRAVTHPNEIFAKAPAQFQLDYQGKPLPGALVTVYRAAGVYDGKKVAAEVKTDANGRFSVTPPDGGTYLALIRHRTEAPAGSATPYRSYSYALTFEATQ